MKKRDRKSDRFKNWKAPKILEGRPTRYGWLVQNKKNLKPVFMGRAYAMFFCPVPTCLGKLLIGHSPDLPDCLGVKMRRNG